MSQSHHCCIVGFFFNLGSCCYSLVSFLSGSSLPDISPISHSIRPLFSRSPPGRSVSRTLLTSHHIRSCSAVQHVEMPVSRLRLSLPPSEALPKRTQPVHTAYGNTSHSLTNGPDPALDLIYRLYNNHIMQKPETF